MNQDTQIGYDQVAAEYARQIFKELDHKPLDRELLARFARRVNHKGPVCDLGCGSGQIARYLRDQGIDEVFGLDLSPGMLAQARQLNPDIEFQQGDMLSLEAADETWAGIAAFYSIIHIPRADVVRALNELKRVLKPGGLLLLTFHIGQNIVHVDTWWEQSISVDFVFFEPDEMQTYLQAAGFELEEVIVREPYPEVEHQSRRAYIFARKPI